MTAKQAIKEIFIGSLQGIFMGLLWHFGHEAMVVGFMSTLLFIWKLEWNRKIQ